MDEYRCRSLNGCEQHKITGLSSSIGRRGGIVMINITYSNVNPLWIQQYQSKSLLFVVNNEFICSLFFSTLFVDKGRNIIIPSL